MREVVQNAKCFVTPGQKTLVGHNRLRFYKFWKQNVKQDKNSDKDWNNKKKSTVDELSF